MLETPQSVFQGLDYKVRVIYGSYTPTISLALPYNLSNQFLLQIVGPRKAF
jgi:hypothetical protein